MIQHTTLKFGMFNIWLLNIGKMNALMLMAFSTGLRIVFNVSFAPTEFESLMKGGFLMFSSKTASSQQLKWQYIYQLTRKHCWKQIFRIPDWNSNALYKQMPKPNATFVKSYWLYTHFLHVGQPRLVFIHFIQFRETIKHWYLPWSACFRCFAFITFHSKW